MLGINREEVSHLKHKTAYLISSFSGGNMLLPYQSEAFLIIIIIIVAAAAAAAAAAHCLHRWKSKTCIRLSQEKEGHDLDGEKNMTNRIE